MRMEEVICFKPWSQPFSSTEFYKFYNFTNITSYIFDQYKEGRQNGLENKPCSAKVWR